MGVFGIFFTFTLRISCVHLLTIYLLFFVPSLSLSIFSIGKYLIRLVFLSIWFFFLFLFDCYHWGTLQIGRNCFFFAAAVSLLKISLHSELQFEEALSHTPQTNSPSIVENIYFDTLYKRETIHFDSKSSCAPSVF